MAKVSGDYGAVMMNRRHNDHDKGQSSTTATADHISHNTHGSTTSNQRDDSAFWNVNSVVARHDHDVSPSLLSDPNKKYIVERSNEEPRLVQEDLLDNGFVNDDNQLFIECNNQIPNPLPAWEPSGIWWKDMLYFCGPGWLISIAYIDPGNYQADIQAGATTQYYLLFSIWWSSILSIYVQILCVRLGYYTQQTLAQIQAREFQQQQQSTIRLYFAWFVAEFSVVLTDLPEVIGIGIALNLFFGWPYWIGVILSLLTTMSFLASQNFGMNVLEYIIFGFVGIMSIALFVEMSFVNANSTKIVQGWVYGFVDVTSKDLFTIAGILGSVVMPHNLYLHTATLQSRKVAPREGVVQKAVWYCSIEPILPIIVSFFVNLAVVSIAAESVFGNDNAESVGLTDFCNYFRSLKGGCLLWGIALLAAGQSSAITTTYTGQYIMDGFLRIRLPTEIRAMVTRLIAITPCVIVSVLFPTQLNAMVNVVNAALSFLLPFALLPLIKYNCSSSIMGPHRASRGVEKIVLYSFGVLVWLINAITLSVPGGGFFGDFVNHMEWSRAKFGWITLQILIQIFYAWWNFSCLFVPVTLHLPVAIEENSTPEGGLESELT